jgi:hypothetical protein
MQSTKSLQPKTSLVTWEDAGMGPQTIQSFVDQAEGKALIRKLIGEADRIDEKSSYIENRAERRARRRRERRS